MKMIFLSGAIAFTAFSSAPFAYAAQPTALAQKVCGAVLNSSPKEHVACLAVVSGEAQPFSRIGQSLENNAQSIFTVEGGQFVQGAFMSVLHIIQDNLKSQGYRFITQPSYEELASMGNSNEHTIAEFVEYIETRITK